MPTVLSLDQVLQRQPDYARQLGAGIAAGKSWAPEHLERLQQFIHVVRQTFIRYGVRLDSDESATITQLGEVVAQGGIVNPNLGELVRAVVLDDSGKPMWDQYAIWEMPGAVTVPYHTQGGYHIGLIHVARPIVGPQNFASREAFRQWLDDPTKRDYTMSWEVPRGFGLPGEKPRDAALREFRSELGNRTKGLVVGVEELGPVNPNTAFYSNRGIDAFAIEVDPTRVDSVRLDPEVKEKIAKAEYRSFGQVRELMTSPEMFCGLSKAALGTFIARHFDDLAAGENYVRGDSRIFSR